MKKHSHNKTPRIVSLAPSATSILCAIGAKSVLVGVTKWCPDVAPVSHLPKLGDCWHLKSVNEMLKLKPSLVIGSVPFKQETVAKLLQQPFHFLAMNPRTLVDIAADIRLLGGITQRNAAAERFAQKMSRKLSEIASQTRRFPRRVRVYCEAWSNPRISSPPWVSELVAICGGEMVVPGGAKVTEAQVAAANPDLIILAWAATGTKARPSKTYQVPNWKNVSAIRNREVHVIRDEWLNTPGPPLLHGARTLFKLFADYHRRRPTS